MEVLFFNLKSDKIYSTSPFLQDVMDFMVKHDFSQLYIDEDDNLVFHKNRVDAKINYSYTEPFTLQEFRKDSKTYLAWEKLQNRYQKGER
jgi:hypothetical protein